MSSVDSKAIILPSPLIEGLRLMPSSVVLVTRRNPPDCVWPARRPIRQSAVAPKRTRAIIRGRVRSFISDKCCFVVSSRPENIDKPKFVGQQSGIASRDARQHLQTFERPPGVALSVKGEGGNSTVFSAKYNEAGVDGGPCI